MGNFTSTTLADVFSHVWIFEDLSMDELLRISRLATTRVYEPRKTIVAKGEPASAFFVLLRGRAKVTTRGADGSETAFNVIGPGEVFGEIAMLDGQPRSATVTSLEQCEMAVVDKRSFHDLLTASPSITVKLLAVLARRTRELTTRMEDRAFLDVPARLAKQLVWLADNYGTQSGSQVRIELVLSQQELGDLIGATRESVDEQLREWTRSGIVGQERGRIEISDLGTLRAASEPH